MIQNLLVHYTKNKTKLNQPIKKQIDITQDLKFKYVTTIKIYDFLHLMKLHSSQHHYILKILHKTKNNNYLNKKSFSNNNLQIQNSQ